MKLQLDKRRFYGIVLEGGGARGAYQIGAWKALKGVCTKECRSDSRITVDRRIFCCSTTAVFYIAGFGRNDANFVLPTHKNRFQNKSADHYVE